VEHLDWESGEVSASSESLAEAKRAMGMAPNSGCIRDVCTDGGRGSANGFFWRWKGSDSMPNHFMGATKVMEIRKKRNGKVVKVFKSSKGKFEILSIEPYRERSPSLFKASVLLGYHLPILPRRGFLHGLLLAIL
jgi:hypothetical protein